MKMYFSSTLSILTARSSLWLFQNLRGMQLSGRHPLKHSLHWESFSKCVVFRKVGKKSIKSWIGFHVKKFRDFIFSHIAQPYFQVANFSCCFMSLSVCEVSVEATHFQKLSEPFIKWLFEFFCCSVYLSISIILSFSRRLCFPCPCCSVYPFPSLLCWDSLSLFVQLYLPSSCKHRCCCLPPVCISAYLSLSVPANWCSSFLQEKPGWGCSHNLPQNHTVKDRSVLSSVSSKSFCHYSHRQESYQ